MIKNLKQFFYFAGLLLVAAGAQPAYTAVFQWSTTASVNATADPTINWSEGMSPSSVNDSARAMMAAIAVARKDWQANSGIGGSPSALTFTSNQGFSSFAAMDGQMIAFVGTANNAGATLNVDSLGAKPIVLDAVGTPIPAGTFVTGTPYVVTYYNSTGEFRLWSFYGNPYAIPLGGLMAYTGLTAPNSNFILPAGQCISTTTYAAYWVLMGSPASGSCPGGQFAVVDMRGKVPAALDNLNGTAANLMTNSGTGCGTTFTTVGAICANGSQSHTLTTAEMPSHAHTLTDPGHTHTYIRGNISGQSGASGTVVGDLTPGVATGSSVTGISMASTGGGGAHAIVQPTIAVTYLLRVI